MPEILTGNIISDFVKGKKKFDYPPGIQQGIHLHRLIDSFTDEHPSTHAAKKVFSPVYRLYSGAFVDVVYDHFLANDPSCFAPGELFGFSQQVYQALDKYKTLFPEKFRPLFNSMKLHNWLYNYREKEGIGHSFEGLRRRSAYIEETKTAFALFGNNYEMLQQYYYDFFPSVMEFSRTAIETLL